MTDMTDATPTIEEMIAAFERSQRHADLSYKEWQALQAIPIALSSLSPLIEATREVLQQLDKGYDNVAIYKLGAVRDALSTFPAPASPWRPIETAPKDGTYILGNKRFLDAGWSPRVLRWEKGAWLTDPGDWSQKPEVWQPLPAPPATSDGQDK